MVVRVRARSTPNSLNSPKEATKIQARRSVFVSGGYKFVRTLYNLVVKVVCLSRIFDLGVQVLNLGGTMYPPSPIVPTPLPRFIIQTMMAQVDTGLQHITLTI